MNDTATHDTAEIAEPDTSPWMSIGKIAGRADVSTRTLRYYQELGLLDPAGSSPGGNRRYSEADLIRLQRILELRNVMGFELERIGDILQAEDRLTDLRREVRTGVSDRRRIEILREADKINASLLGQVAAKFAVLEEFAAELKAKQLHYRTLAVELGIDLDR